jgi:hypothetical protein
VTLDVVRSLQIHFVKREFVLHYSRYYVDVAQLGCYAAEGLVWSPDPGYWWCCAPVLSGLSTVFSEYSH